MHDSVDTGNGEYEINGRVIHDEHHIGRAPLADVLRWSSNIGIVKFSERLSRVAAVRDAARLRLRDADRRSVSDGVGRHASHAESVVEAVGELAGDGL